MPREFLIAEAALDMCRKMRIDTLQASLLDRFAIRHTNAMQLAQQAGLLQPELTAQTVGVLLREEEIKKTLETTGGRLTPEKQNDQQDLPYIRSRIQQALREETDPDSFWSNATVLVEEVKGDKQLRMYPDTPGPRKMPGDPELTDLNITASEYRLPRSTENNSESGKFDWEGANLHFGT